VAVFPYIKVQLHLQLKFSHNFRAKDQVGHIDFDQQKAAWFENAFCLSCASYYCTLDNGPLLSMKFH